MKDCVPVQKERQKHIQKYDYLSRMFCPKLFGQYKKNPYGMKYKILSNKLASFFKWSQFCICLDTLVVVEVDVLPYEEASLLKSFQFHPMNTLSFENGEEIFRHCVIICDLVKKIV